MSTKAIRALILKVGAEWGGEETDAAEAEVKAIERACEVIEAGAGASKPERREADELLSRIAWEVIDRKMGAP